MLPHMRFPHRDVAACIGLLLLSSATAISICSDCPSALHWSDPGVGFDLTLDLGTSAVHFLNRTTVPIAAIEGNAAYKQQLRELVQAAVAGNWTGATPVPVPAWLQFIRGLFNSKLWPAPSPLQSMLKMLKTDTEAYLGHSIHSAEVSFPAWLALDSYQVRAIDVALGNLGITRAALATSQPMRAAAGVYGIGDLPDSQRPQWVLGVDYSRSALAIAVDQVDRGVFENFAWKIRIDLGYDSARDHSIGAGVQSLTARPNYWKAVEEELRQALKVLNRGKIEHLILVGDRIMAGEHLLKMLGKVLGQETFNDVIREHTALQERGATVNPLFAGAMGQAQVSDGYRGQSPNGCFYAGNCPGAEVWHDEL